MLRLRAGPRITQVYPFERAVFIFRSARRRILDLCCSTGLATTVLNTTALSLA
jgi:hypothetical protein